MPELDKLNRTARLVGVLGGVSLASGTATKIINYLAFSSKDSATNSVRTLNWASDLMSIIGHRSEGNGVNALVTLLNRNTVEGLNDQLSKRQIVPQGCETSSLTPLFDQFAANVLALGSQANPDLVLNRLNECIVQTSSQIPQFIQQLDSLSSYLMIGGLSAIGVSILGIAAIDIYNIYKKSRNG